MKINITYFQRIKYYIYIIIHQLISKKALMFFASSPKTKIIRDIFFRPDGHSEIYTKKINYFQFTMTVSCPLQVLIKAERKGIEPSLSRLIMNAIQPDDHCIDIGANYGFITFVMAKTVGSKGYVYSFESDSNIYKILRKMGMEVLLDDRPDRLGAKFKDAELLGIPIQIVVGLKNLGEGKIEIKLRKTGESLLVSYPEEIADIFGILSKL